MEFSVGTGDGNASASLAGTFLISSPDTVTFIAEVVYEYYATYGGNEASWLLEIWDIEDPSTILLQLDENNVSGVLMLEGDKAYGVDLSSHCEINMTVQANVQFSAVPEPATMGLLGAGGLALLKRRQK
jgi:hypothetical protein